MKKTLFLLILVCLTVVLPAACVSTGAALTPATPIIDQTGYLPDAAKFFLISTAGLKGVEAFTVIADGSGAAAFTGRLSPEALDDIRLSGIQLFRGDFTGLATPGTYRAIIAGRESARFRIDKAVYRPVAADALRSLSLIRANTAVNDSLTGKPAYHKAALEQLHYILGRNALDRSFVCGHGEHAVQHPYHWASYVYGVALPGWVAGGANPDPGGADPLLAALQRQGTPPSFCFVDECRADGSRASNEGTLAMTGALVFLAGMF